MMVVFLGAMMMVMFVSMTVVAVMMFMLVAVAVVAVVMLVIAAVAVLAMVMFVLVHVTIFAMVVLVLTGVRFGVTCMVVGIHRRGCQAGAQQQRGRSNRDKRAVIGSFDHGMQSCG